MSRAAVLGVLSILLLTAVPAASGEPPPADDTGVHGEVVTYEVGGVKLTGYLAYDPSKQGQRPGVLVVHEWWGHNDYARKRAEMLAELGYTAFALDMYGDGKLAEHPEDAQKFSAEVLADIDGAVARFDAARKLLEEHPTTDPEKTAAIGYCFGGSVVLHMARIGSGLDAVASFHGGLGAITPAQPGIEKTRILVLTGADDPFAPPASVEQFEKEMAEAGADMKLISYPGAKHSFTNPGSTAVGEKFGLPLVYDEKADHESWKELESFLAETFADS